MKNEVVDWLDMSQVKAGIIEAAHHLLSDNHVSREEVALELLEYARRIHELESIKVDQMDDMLIQKRAEKNHSADLLAGTQ